MGFETHLVEEGAVEAPDVLDGPMAADIVEDGVGARDGGVLEVKGRRFRVSTDWNGGGCGRDGLGRVPLVRYGDRDGRGGSGRGEGGGGELWVGVYSMHS